MKTLYYLAGRSTSIPFYVGYSSRIEYVIQQIYFYSRNTWYLSQHISDNKEREISRLLRSGDKIDVVPLYQVVDEKAASEKQQIVDVLCSEGHRLVNGSVRRHINDRYVPRYVKHQHALCESIDT